MTRRAPIPFSKRKQAPEPAIEFDASRPCIVPGRYPGYCRWAGQYRDPQYKRWTVLLKFDVFSPDLQQIVAKDVPIWFRLGDGEQPRASRRSEYLKQWVKANDGAPPVRGDRLSPQIFKGRVASVQIGNANSPVPYPKITRIIEWQTGQKTAPPPHPVIRQSTNPGKA
jgi:hypothetical protein